MVILTFNQVRHRLFDVPFVLFGLSSGFTSLRQKEFRLRAGDPGAIRRKIRRNTAAANSPQRLIRLLMLQKTALSVSNRSPVVSLSWQKNVVKRTSEKFWCAYYWLALILWAVPHTAKVWYSCRPRPRVSYLCTHCMHPLSLPSQAPDCPCFRSPFR